MQQQVRTWASPPDKASILEQLDPSQDIDRLVLSLLGLSRRETKTDITLVRISQPLFTYEYVIQLKSLLEGFLSFTAQISRWEDNRIREHTRQAVLALLRNLATHGNDNYISSASWSFIKRIHDNGTWDSLSMPWKYNDPVRFDMLELIRIPEEDVDQGLVFGSLVRQMAVLIEGSLAKGFAAKYTTHGMMPSLLGEVHNEVYSMQDRPQNQVPSAVMSEDRKW